MKPVLKAIIARAKEHIERWQSGLETDAAYQKRTGFHPTVRPQYGDVILYCDHITVFSGKGPIMSAPGGIGVARNNGTPDLHGIEIQIDWIATCRECTAEICDEDPNAIIISEAARVQLLKKSFKLRGQRIIWKWPLP